MDTIELQWLNRNNTAGQPGKFLEFFINHRPLSQLLTELYQSKTSILQDWTGVLGSFPNEHQEIIKLKQLLGKTVTEKEIRATLPQHWSENELAWYLDKSKEELANPEVLIYGCACCGDYDCGGISTRITKTGDEVIWTIPNKGKDATFRFNKYSYFDTFNARLNYLEKKNRLSHET